MKHDGWIEEPVTDEDMMKAWLVDTFDWDDDDYVYWIEAREEELAEQRLLED